ncbi:hypothetical protein GmHk_17G048206 [Glycine max]|nr:hypothetical protein GmHk_17G048206 [Glycine max]
MSHSNDQNQPQAYESKDIAPGPNYQVPPPAIITHEEKLRGHVLLLLFGRLLLRFQEYYAYTIDVYVLVP